MAKSAVRSVVEMIHEMPCYIYLDNGYYLDRGEPNPTKLGIRYRLFQLLDEKPLGFELRITPQHVLPPALQDQIGGKANVLWTVYEDDKYKNRIAINSTQGTDPDGVALWITTQGFIAQV